MRILVKNERQWRRLIPKLSGITWRTGHLLHEWLPTELPIVVSVDDNVLQFDWDVDDYDIKAKKFSTVECV